MHCIVYCIFSLLSIGMCAVSTICSIFWWRRGGGRGGGGGGGGGS